MAWLPVAPARRKTGRLAAGLGASLVALLSGCASPPEIQTLATGRVDVSAYALNGSDLTVLRQEASRLCPLGGEVLRQSSQGQTMPEPADGRWRRVLQATALWIDPPLRAAQMVIVCREPGDRMRLAAAPSVAASASAASAPPDTTEWRVGLPVGPVTPEW